MEGLQLCLNSNSDKEIQKKMLRGGGRNETAVPKLILFCWQSLTFIFKIKNSMLDTALSTLQILTH